MRCCKRFATNPVHTDSGDGTYPLSADARLAGIRTAVTAIGASFGLWLAVMAPPQFAPATALRNEQSRDQS